MERSGADMVDGGWQRVTPAGVSAVNVPCHERSDGAYLCMLLCQNVVSNRMWGRLYRRSLFTGNGICLAAGIDYSEDYSVMTRVMFYAGRSFIDDPVYFYSDENQSSYTHTASEKHVRSYLRANRVVLDFFTANDAYPVAQGQRPPLYESSITASHYALDSHAVHKREKGKIALDGFFNYQASVYTVPFGVILPKKVDNLLIPVPASATHVGFSTLRMEPCWMALGQAAGVAAALSIDQNKSVKELDVEDVQSVLMREKATLIYFKDVTIDSPDFEMVQYMGLKGYINGWNADLDKPVDNRTAEQWSAKSGIAIDKFEGKTRGEVLRAVYTLIK